MRALVVVALGLPFLATGGVLATLLGPGQPREVGVVQAVGAGPTWRSLRLQATRERAGVSSPFVGVLTVVRASGASLDVETSERGTVELTLEPPAEEGEPLQVYAAAELLFDGALGGDGGARAFLGDRWSFSAPSARGGPPLAVRVRLRHGVIAPPFRALVEVTTSRDGAPVDAAVSFTTVSGEPERGEVRTGSEGRAEIAIVPLGVPVRLSLEVAEAGDVARRSGDLPGQMGAIVPTLDGEDVVLTSPSPRGAAYLSIFDERGRRGGGEATLAAEADGFFRGRIRDVHPPAGAVLLVSPHALEDEARAYVWRAQDGSAFCPEEPTGLLCTPAPTLARVVADGGPRVRTIEASRVAGVRRALTTFLSVALAIELALVLVIARRTRSPAPTSARESPTDDAEYAIREVSAVRQPAFVVVLILVAGMFGLWAWLMTP